MDKKSEEANRLSCALIEAEIRLRTVKTQIIGIDKEISIINSIEANLVENIQWLIKEKIIAVALEFKKAREDLKTARNRRAFLDIDKNSCLKVQKDLESAYNKVKLEYERALAGRYSPHNVIQIDFVRKDGK